MKRHRLIITTVVLLAVVVGSYMLLLGTDAMEGQFPELRPTLDAPPGYAWEFNDGPDFYIWLLAQSEKIGKRHRSGVGIYFGHHPNLSATEKATERVSGRACGKQVSWLVQRNQHTDDPWVRRDAVLKYDHGPGYCAIALHVWVWGMSEEQVAGLARQIEGLSFAFRQP